MVKKIKRDGREIYVCEICGFRYADKETAEECQKYCSAHNACSLEITSKAIFFPKPA
jgi:rubrerythrin